MTKLIIKNDTTPSTPESGKTALYIDSTTKKLVSKNDAGVETMYDEAGIASSANALNSATTTVSVSGATAPTIGQVLTATGDSAATWQTASGGANSLDDLSDATSDGSSYFIGTDAGLNDDGTTNLNVGIGAESLKACTSGSQNIGIGGSTLKAVVTSNFNVAVGYASLVLTTGAANSTLGASTGTAITTGGSNTGMGFSSLSNLTSGSSNTGVGAYSLFGTAASTASSNTAIGYSAGFNVTTATNNILIGYQAGDLLTTGSNNIIIGHTTDPSGATVSNELNIGDVITGDLSTGNVSITGSLEFQSLVGSNDNTSGIFQSGGTNLKLSITGIDTFTFGSGGTSCLQSFVMSNNKTFVVGAGGSVSSVGLNFGNDVNTGLYATGFGDQFYAVAGGVECLEFLPAEVDFKLPINLASYATGSLPAAGAGNEGWIVYDSTTKTVKWSNGTAWATI